ncbi:hypothetical protein [Iodidimonas sp. SYSU 1G8]|uniref:hypothetical protein n=1 Tax=Iodidimonas sp. SYSU 1G8 TaxID=3133967 RepID=UPI0031FE698F
MKFDLAETISLVRNAAIKQAEAALRARLTLVDASPFLGQYELAAEVARGVHDFLQGPQPIARIEPLFRLSPAVAVAYFASLAQRETGLDGQGELYPHFEAELGSKLSPLDRERFYQAFRRACVDLGLPVLTELQLRETGTWRRRNEYQLQAGPVDTVLPDLASACLQVERELGAPDPHDPDGLRFWHEALVDRLEQRGPKNLPRVLRHDVLGWHSLAFGRLADGNPPQSAFEARFASAINTSRSLVRDSYARLGPRPEVLFNGDEIVIVTPLQATGWTWTVRGSWSGEVVIKAGEELPVSFEDSVSVETRRLDFEADDEPVTSRQFPIWTASRFSIFDAASGRHVSLEAPAGQLYLVSREPFNCDQEPASQSLSGLWMLTVEMFDGDRRVVRLADGSEHAIMAHAVPRLIWSSPAVCDIGGVPVFSGASLGVESALPREMLLLNTPYEVVLRTSTGELSRSAVVFDEAGSGRADFPVLEPGANFDRLTAALVRSGEQRALVQAASAWLWPRLDCLEDGCFVGSVPENFDQSASIGLVVRDRGITIGAGVDRSVELAFRRAEGSHYRIRLPRPGIFLELEEGANRRGLDRGSTILDDGRPLYLRVYCDDREASLAFGTRVETRAFGALGVRRLSLTGLHGDEGDAKVELYPGGNPVSAITLAIIAQPCTPRRAGVERRGGRSVLECTFDDDVSLFEFEGINLLTGDVERLSRNDGVSQEQVQGVWRLYCAERSIADGVWLFEAQARLRPGAQPSPLRSARGDHYGLAVAKENGTLVPLDSLELMELPEDTKALAFSRLSSALAICWAPECWHHHLVALERLWSVLGRELSDAAALGDTEARDVLIRSAGVAPPPDANPTWVPLRHPLEVWPGLFSADRTALAGNLRDADDEGARNLASWLDNPPAKNERLASHDEACRRFADRVERASRGEANQERISHAAALCSLAYRELGRSGDVPNYRVPESPPAVSRGASIVEAAPAFFAELAKASRMNRAMPGAVDAWCARTFEDVDSRRSPIAEVGFLCRLGPELLSWYLNQAMEVWS